MGKSNEPLALSGVTAQFIWISAMVPHASSISGLDLIAPLIAITLAIVAVWNKEIRTLFKLHKWIFFFYITASTSAIYLEPMLGLAYCLGSFIFFVRMENLRITYNEETYFMKSLDDLRQSSKARNPPHL